MPNFSGTWSMKEQAQAVAAGRWPGVSLSELYGWGSSAFGRFGGNGLPNQSAPVQITSLTTWEDISSGSNSTVARTASNELYSWGQNSNGILGINNIANTSSPTQIGTGTDWYRISMGQEHCLATKRDNSLWAWGRSALGGLGDNQTTNNYSSPIQIGALTNWENVSAGRLWSAALKTDGTIWSWGQNNAGQLGHGSTILRSSPVQIGALTDWAVIDAGYDHCVALKTNGTLWAWGNNPWGSIGDNTTVSKSSPVQIGALTNWSQISAGLGQQTHAIKTDGTLWSWGQNYAGRLGDGTVYNKSSPVQIGALTTWTQVWAGVNMSGAVRSDGTAWAWGFNSSGQLGDNTTSNRSSPVQTGSDTSWVKVVMASAHGQGIQQVTVT